MAFILLVMLAMVVGSIIVELVLPQGVKATLGTIVCHGLQAVTLTFLGISTLALIWATLQRFNLIGG